MLVGLVRLRFDPAEVKCSGRSRNASIPGLRPFHDGEPLATSSTMIRKPIHRFGRIALGIASVFLLVGSYTYVSNQAYKKNPNQKTIPGWTQGDRSIVKGIQKITTSDERDDAWLFADAGVSMKRFGLGILLGASLAFVVGITMGCFTPAEAFLLPPISFLASIPPTAMVVVYMLLFGLELKMFVAVIGIGIFPTLTQAIYQAVKNDVSDSAIDKAYTLGASHFEVIWEVIIPQILPRIIDAIRLQVGPAMIFLIAVELGLGSEGIGYRLRNAPRGNYYNVIFIYLILLGIFGMLVDWGLSALRRWWCPWFEGANS